VDLAASPVFVPKPPIEVRSVAFVVIIPEIDIWRVANLMLKRYGSEAEVESTRRADELWEDGDAAGVAVWRGLWAQSGSL